jgi:hypothetical protein
MILSDAMTEFSIIVVCSLAVLLTIDDPIEPSSFDDSFDKLFFSLKEFFFGCSVGF